MSTIADLWVRVLADTSKLVAGLNGASGTIRSFGKTVTRAGSTLTRNVTLPIVGVGVASAHMSMEFEDSMQQIAALVGTNQRQVNAWGEEILSMSDELPQAPKELADALYFVTSAGFSGSEALDVMEASAKAAAAGLGETMVVADAVTSAVNAYGIANLDAVAATDVLTATVREGKAEADSLSGAIGRVIPVASEMGVSFNEVGGAIAGMTLSGLDANEAVTSLRGILSGLLKPTSQTEELMKKLGTSADEVRTSLDQKGLLATLFELKDLVGGNKEALGELFPNVRALAGFLNLTGKNAKKNERIMEELAGAGGDTAEAFEKASETVGFQWRKSMAALSAGAIKMGDALAPVIGFLGEKLTALADAFRSLTPQGRTMVVVGLGIAAALGPVLKIVGFLIQGFGLLAGVSAPVLLVVAAVVALGIALVHLWRTNKTFRANVIKAWQQVQVWVSKVVDQLKGILQSFVQLVTALWERFGENILSAVKTVWDYVRETIENVLQFIQGVIDLVMGIITGDWSRAWDGIKNIVGAVWDQILNIVQTAIRLTVTILAAAVKLLWNAGKALIFGLWNGIKTAFVAVVEWFGRLPGTIASFFARAGRWLWDAGKSILRGAWDGIKAIWEGVRSWFAELPGKILGFFADAGTWLWEAGKEMAAGLWQGFKDSLIGPGGFFHVDFGGVVTDLKNDIKNALGISSPARVMVPIGQALADGIALGVQQHADLIANALEVAVLGDRDRRKATYRQGFTAHVNGLLDDRSFSLDEDKIGSAIAAGMGVQVLPVAFPDEMEAASLKALRRASMRRSGL